MLTPMQVSQNHRSLAPVIFTGAPGSGMTYSHDPRGPTRSYPPNVLSDASPPECALVDKRRGVDRDSRHGGDE
jgi:hypothetical protein